MSYIQVKAVIDSNVFPNGQELVDANMVNTAITALLNQTSNDVGDTDTLQIGSNLVSAINELFNRGSGDDFPLNVFFGTNNPNNNPPLDFGVGDFYIRDYNIVYQYSRGAWVEIGAGSIQNLQQTLTAGNTTDIPVISKNPNNSGDVLEVGDVATGFFGSLYVMDAEFLGGNEQTMQAWSGRVKDPLSGLIIEKRPTNVLNHIQQYDHAKGWISENLYIDGFYKKLGGTPTLADLQNKDNWSGFVELP